MDVPRQLQTIRDHALPCSGSSEDYDALMELARDRHFVLLGEASHGTSEFYRMRAEISARLIDELGFDAVAVEADWPDAYRINRYVRGQSNDSLDEAFGDFHRFPEWMWCNHDARDFVEWLQQHNAGLEDERRVGFYGLDLYSLSSSIAAVLAYLQRVDPAQAEVARRRYACFGHIGEPQQYGYEVAFRLKPSCEAEVLEQLRELRTGAAEALSPLDQDRHFCAEQNALVVKNAEAYYRAMFGSRINTWNLRDSHMADVLFALQRHLKRRGREGRIAVWAHNSHIGDARATEMGRRDELNLGQLVRERSPAGDSIAVGFTTHTGQVSAAQGWDEPVRQVAVRPSLADSYERRFHDSGVGDFFLPLSGELREALSGPLLERAIGVIYLPDTERAAHYFNASLSAQFDAVFHIDETSAVEPLDPGEYWLPEGEVELMAHPTRD